jgi:hypothetical protein
MFISPADGLRLWFHTAMMVSEAQMVIAMRLMGMAGMWRVPRGEDRRMVAEKAGAAMASGLAAGTALLQGKSPPEVALAALKPVRKRTRGNVTRLARRGPGR